MCNSKNKTKETTTISYDDEKEKGRKETKIWYLQHEKKLMKREVISNVNLSPSLKNEFYLKEISIELEVHFLNAIESSATDFSLINAQWQQQQQQQRHYSAEKKT